VTCDDSAIELEIFIAAVPATIFPFLVDPTLMARWFGRSHQIDARPGGTFQVEVSQGNIACGVYTEITPFHRVVFTWGWDSDDHTLAIVPPGVSLVEIDLEPKEGGTLLRLRHSRLPKRASEMHGDRWAVYLGRLKAELQPSDHDRTPNKGQKLLNRRR
jgi:uncharacterized protein YndB with AHSA1/START domain